MIINYTVVSRAISRVAQVGDSFAAYQLESETEYSGRELLPFLRRNAKVLGIEVISQPIKFNGGGDVIYFKRTI